MHAVQQPGLATGSEEFQLASSRAFPVAGPKVEPVASSIGMSDIIQSSKLWGHGNIRVNKPDTDGDEPAHL